LLPPSRMGERSVDAPLCVGSQTPGARLAARRGFSSGHLPEATDGLTGPALPPFCASPSARGCGLLRWGRRKVPSSGTSSPDRESNAQALTLKCCNGRESPENAFRQPVPETLSPVEPPLPDSPLS